MFYLIHKCGTRVEFTHHSQKGVRVMQNHRCPKCGMAIEGPSRDLIWVSGAGKHLWARVKWFFRKFSR